MDIRWSMGVQQVLYFETSPWINLSLLFSQSVNSKKKKIWSKGRQG